MTRRGRPPHPDILTPREWEVLRLIERGLTNEQIARRLGISFDGAKFHVAQILSKLGVASRREAVAVAEARRTALGRRWARLSFGLSLTKAAKIAAAGALAATAGAVLILALFVLRNSPGERPFDLYPGLYVLDLDTGNVDRFVDLRGRFGVGYDWSNDQQALILTSWDSQSNKARLQIVDAKSGAVLRQDSLNADDLSFTQLVDGRLGITIRKRQADSDGHDEGGGLMNPATLQLSDFRPYANLDGIDWSPDGTQAVVTADFDAARIGNETYLVDLTGARAPGPASEHRWSPDGKLYARSGALASTIEIVEASNAALRGTLQGSLYPGAWWSPDSRWIAFVDQTTGSILITPVDGSSGPRLIAQGDSPRDILNGPTMREPSWSPDSTSLAYIKDGQLWTVEAATGISRLRVPAGLPVLTDPRWSPDGRRIAFRAEGESGIYVANADGTGSRFVVTGYNPELSPDGGRIAFEYAGIRTIGSDGRGLAKVAGVDNSGHLPPFCGTWSDVDWSPDGEYLAVQDSAWDGDILVARQDGSDNPVKLGVGYAPRWSPDGTRLVYVKGPPGSGPRGSSLCTVQLITRAGVELASWPGRTARWLPSGNLLIASRGANGEAGPELIVNRDGKLLAEFPTGAILSPKGDVMAIAESVRRADGLYYTLHLRDARSGATLKTVSGARQPAFSPDGTTLAFIQHHDVGFDDVNRQSLMLLTLADLQERPVQTGWDFNDFAWSPDSTRLAYTYNLGQAREIHILNLKSMATTTSGAIGSGIQWFPDGRRFLYQGP